MFQGKYLRDITGLKLKWTYRDYESMHSGCKDSIQMCFQWWGREGDWQTQALNPKQEVSAIFACEGRISLL